MEALALLLLAVALYSHSWDLLAVTRSKNTSSVAAAIGIVLVLAALFSSAGLAGGRENLTVASLAILWGIYALFVAGGGFSEQEPRGLGLYALPLAAGSLVLAWKLISPADEPAVAGYLGAGAAVAAVPFALLFIYGGLNATRLERTYGYIQLISSAIIGALAAAAYFAA